MMEVNTGSFILVASCLRVRVCVLHYQKYYGGSSLFLEIQSFICIEYIYMYTHAHTAYENILCCKLTYSRKTRNFLLYTGCILKNCCIDWILQEQNVAQASFLCEVRVFRVVTCEKNSSHLFQVIGSSFSRCSAFVLANGQLFNKCKSWMLELMHVMNVGETDI